MNTMKYITGGAYFALGLTAHQMFMERGQVDEYVYMVIYLVIAVISFGLCFRKVLSIGE